MSRALFCFRELKEKLSAKLLFCRKRKIECRME
jgi:hypothetical protein